MGVEAIRFASGVAHFSTVDAVFRDAEGRPVVMCFHPYLGPTFEVDDEPIDLDEDDPIWAQFYGWWHAKGQAIYRET